MRSPGCRPLADDPQAVDHWAEFHRPVLGLVAFVDDQHIAPALVGADGMVGDQHLRARLAGLQPDLGEQPRRQLPVRVVHHRPNPDRAGPAVGGVGEEIEATASSIGTRR